MFTDSTLVIVDGRPFQSPVTGVGYYILDVLLRWQLVEPRTRFVVVSQLPVVDSVASNFEVVTEPKASFRKLKSALWHRFFSRRLFSEFNYTVYWGGAGFIPFGLKECVKVVTIHDFNHIYVPATMSFPNRMAHVLWMKADILTSDYIIVNSRGTRDKLSEFTERIADVIINPLVRPSIARVAEDAAHAELVAAGVNGRFLLAVGTHQPRKNLFLLLQAFVELKQQGHLGGFSLVLAGASGWRSAKIDEMIVAGSRCGVISMGYVSDPLLSALYSQCEAFIFPSIYEGFGMPAREAAVCGAPLICSDVPEIREAADGVGIFVEPSMEALSEAMRILDVSVVASVAVDRTRMRAEFENGVDVMREGIKSQLNVKQ